MQQNERSDPRKAKPTPSNPMDKVRDTVTQICLIVVTITLFAYEWFGAGAAIEVGVGINKKTYYQPGYEHLDMFLLASIIMIFITFLIVSFGSKKDK